MSTGELLSIEPQELQFPFELRKQISCSLQLSNKTNDYVAFKVKTTNPKKYCVRPNTGVVLPRSTCDVIVTMQAQKEAPLDMQCKDKFLLQSAVATPGTTTKDITAEMFNKESGHNVEECKLRVLYVAPPRPPSPVREGSEEGSSPRASVDNGSAAASEFKAASRAFSEQHEPQDNSSEARTLIARLTEEKNSAIQQTNRLQQELAVLRRGMESVVPLHRIHCLIPPTWKLNHSTNSFLFPRILTTKPSPKPRTPFPSSLCYSHPFPQPNIAAPRGGSTKHTTLLVETFHEHQRLKDLLVKVTTEDCCPLQLLADDGDWTKDQFWAVITFLNNVSRSKEILQLFEMWKKIEKSRINEFNYSKIIGLLSEEGLMEEAAPCFQEMKSHDLRPSLEVYNSMIHGFARQGNFDDALFYLSEMREMNVAPETDTYDGLMEAYGKYKMYDEMGMCVKKMKLNGCPPDHITYNLLIREFSRGGLLKRMESVYQSMLSKRMFLQSSTLIAMLEVYAKFGILDKMEKVYMRLLNSRTLVKDDLIRKLAEVYIENYMFSRLENLGVDISSRFGQTDLVWCLRLLSHAGLLSRRGMDSIVREMKEENAPWNATVANTIMLAYLKMKDFTHLRILLSQLLTQGVEPDIITVGILFDANMIGYDGSGTLDAWKKKGLLQRSVEMNTDPLVLTTFGKGHFLRNCEAAFSSLEPEVRENKTWTYHHLIDLVLKHTESSLITRDAMKSI